MTCEKKECGCRKVWESILELGEDDSHHDGCYHCFKDGVSLGWHKAIEISKNEKNKMIDEDMHIIRGKDKRIDELKKQLAEKDAKMALLKEGISDLKRELHEYQHHCVGTGCQEELPKGIALDVQEIKIKELEKQLTQCRLFSGFIKVPIGTKIPRGEMSDDEFNNPDKYPDKFLWICMSKDEIPVVSYYGNDKEYNDRLFGLGIDKIKKDFGSNEKGEVK